jgi:hypothetical protein
MGTGGSFPRVKRQGREAELSPPTSDKVKKTWIYTAISPYVFMAQCWVKHMDNFSSTIFIYLFIICILFMVAVNDLDSVSGIKCLFALTL